MTSVIRKIQEVFKGGAKRTDTKHTDEKPESDTGDIEEKLNDMSLATEDGEGASKDKATGIVKKDVELPQAFKGKLAFVLYNVLTEKECKRYIKKTEKMGYEEALVNIGFGKQKLITSVRNNDRCIWDSFEESGRIWDRIKAYIPDVWRERKVMGLNERLRFLKYVPGQFFKEHMDGSYERENGERSYITIQLYLNEGFKGGSTTFIGYNLKERHEVVPKTGSVLVFQHDILHEGSLLEEGTKYTVRTDVMYGSKKTEDA